MKDHLFPYKWKLADGYPAPGIKYHGSKVFSCFACGGGSTMGYKLAGFDVIGCNDIDPKMMGAYRKNHNPNHSFLAPIQEFKKGPFPPELYELDILDGSPPCSSFSLAGNREKDWGKNKKFKEGQAEQVLDTLFFDFIELAEILQPKVVVAENVKGLILGDAIQYCTKIREDFDRAGYYVERWLLDASKMGVPQKRERVFFIGIRKDLVGKMDVGFVQDMFNPMPALGMNFHEKPITFGEFREDVGSEKGVSETRKELLTHLIDSDKCISDINERLYNKVSGFNALIIRDHDICPTITAGGKNYRAFDSLSMSDGDYKRAGSFPMDYDFDGNDVKYIIGMSVPPVMVAQVSLRIYQQWLSKLHSPK